MGQKKKFNCMKVIGIYIGNFQPPHRGHLRAYKKLNQIVGGEDTFVAITDKVPTAEAPLDRGDKQRIWVKHGVKADKVITVKDLESPVEIFRRFSAAHTVAVFGMNSKEVEDLQLMDDTNTVQEVWIDSTGKPSYFQPHKGNERSMETLDKHSYVCIIEDNEVDGKPISTSNVRSALGSPQYTDEQKKAFFQWAFGWFDIAIFSDLKDTFKKAHGVAVDRNEPATAMPSLASLVRREPAATSVPQTPHPRKPNVNPKAKAQIQQMVREILGELLSPPPMSTPSVDAPSSDSIDEPLDATTRRKNADQARKDAMNKKSASERDLKTLQADLKWKQSDVQRKRRDEIPNKRDEIDMLNKAISNRSI